MAVQWRIYYADGSTFDSDQGAPDDAPGYGALLILQLSEGGRSRDTVYGADFYLFTEAGVWIMADKMSVVDMMVNRVPFSGFLAGRWVHTDDYWEVTKAAYADRDFPLWLDVA